MKNQQKLIERENWDYLIILDACRFDYFVDEYPNFLDGKLFKAVSPASCRSLSLQYHSGQAFA